MEPLHNFNLNNPEHLRKIIQGLMLLMIDNRLLLLVQLSNWRLFLKEEERHRAMDEQSYDKALDTIDFETKPCAEAGLEILIDLAKQIK